MDFIESITMFRLINTKGIELMETLLSAINNENITDKKIKEILETKTTKDDAINNITKKLDTRKETQTMLKM